MKKAKSKIIILSVMIFVMLATFGISVFAIKTQAVDVHTQILISDKGQAKSHVIVSDFVGPSNNSKFTEITSKPTFEPILEKNKEEDSKKSYPPYKYEIEMLKQEQFDPQMKEKILEDNQK